MKQVPATEPVWSTRQTSVSVAPPSSTAPPPARAVGATVVKSPDVENAMEVPAGVKSICASDWPAFRTATAQVQSFACSDVTVSADGVIAVKTRFAGVCTR